MKINFKNILILILIIAVAVAMVSVYTSTLNKDEKFLSSDIVELFDENLVKTFVVDGNLNLKLTAFVIKLNDKGEAVFDDTNGNGVRDAGEAYTLDVDKDGKPLTKTFEHRFSYSFQLEKLNELAEEAKLREGTRLESYDFEAIPETPWYQVYLPYLIFGALLIGFWFFIMKQGAGGGKMNSFAKSKAKLQSDKNQVKFADVAGADEEKAELEEVVEFLKDPTRFIKLGARIPRGVLLVGPPGTGKTLLAKAVAGEAGVPFFSISGSDFVEMYVGVGASRVRDLFDNARKTPASIIFIDEIDAVGRHRGAGLGGGHDEREQTLNQLLVEMDGFGTNSGVIVMAATNRPDILDPALLRPGRFDRRVTVNYPDMKGREAILRVHCRNKPLEATVNLEKIAQTTIGFTGAELANLLNEAALLAAKRGKALIGMQDIEDSYMKLLLGPQKKSKVRTEADNRLCAYHEAGHAVASYFCEHTDPVKHITIIPAGSAGGVTISVPTEDRMTSSRNAMIDHIVLALGGRVAEELVLDDISTGASNDIQQATAIARNMVTRYGMSDKLGTVLYGSEHSQDEVFLGRDFSSGQNYSEKTAAVIDDEIRRIIAECYDRCRKYLQDNIKKLHFVAEFLLKYESMDDDQFRAAMESEDPSFEEIDLIAKERRKRSEEENKSALERLAKEEAEKQAEARATAELGNMLDNFYRDLTQGNLNDVSDSGTVKNPDNSAQNTASDGTPDAKSSENGDNLESSDADAPSDNSDTADGASDNEDTPRKDDKGDTDK